MNRSSLLTLVIAGSLTAAYIITPRMLLLAILLGLSVLGLLVLLMILNMIVSVVLREDSWATIIDKKLNSRRQS